jgi:hypothetical protein
VEEPAVGSHTAWAWGSKLALLLLRCTKHDDVWGTDLFPKTAMYDLILRQGPEGRWLNVSPARKGWDIEGGMMSAVGAAQPRPIC